MLILGYSGSDEFCEQGDAGQEVLFLAKAQVTVRGTVFPNGERQRKASGL